MIETLLDKPAQWLSGEGQDADIAVYGQAVLYRDLADYPFPSQCHDEERQAIEERILSVFDGLSLLATGQYWSFQELSQRERLFLCERRVAPESLAHAQGARGVYIADDQSLSVAINDDDHMTLLGLSSGLELQSMWSRLSLLDDTLAGALDYAFDERLGYLTASINHVGTGLKASVVLHLPGLATTGAVSEITEDVRSKRHAIGPFLSGTDQQDLALGDLYSLSNTSTLGQSEEECLFHLKHLAADIIERERAAREQQRADFSLQLEDRIGRALGLAQGARLLAFSEAVTVLSSLRLGVSEGLLDQFSLQQLNEAFMAAQDVHVEMKSGRDCDELTRSAERAEFFRARFA